MPESAADALPLFPKERPSAETVKEWVEKVKPLLKPDETALIDGDEPRSLLVYCILYTQFAARCADR